MPDWPNIHKELGRKSVTLLLLWQEYRQAQPEDYGYSRFRELYQRWAGTLDPVLRQVHVPGEKMFVEWAGQTVEIHSAHDGSVSAGHLFVAVLGPSSKPYAEAFENERLAAWITAHCHAYAFFPGGGADHGSRQPYPAPLMVWQPCSCVFRTCSRVPSAI